MFITEENYNLTYVIGKKSRKDGKMVLLTGMQGDFAYMA